MKTEKLSMRRGFTLIELLIVIGILAVLATMTVLVLNPMELFRQARDSQRLTDLKNLKNAISIYLVTASNPDIESGEDFTCGIHWGASNTSASSTFTGENTQSQITIARSGIRTVDGTGWVPIDFSVIPGGSPLTALPSDPIENDAYNYSYSCNSTNMTFELDANMESTKYAWNGGADVESTDGGDQDSTYEAGTALNL